MANNSPARATVNGFDWDNKWFKVSIEGISTVDVTAATITSPIDTNTVASTKTRVTSLVDYTASQTAATLWDPAAGKKAVIRKIIISSTTSGAGDITIFVNSDTAANTIAKLHLANSQVVELTFDDSFSGAIDEIIKYTTGSGAVGSITVHGYEI